MHRALALCVALAALSAPSAHGEGEALLLPEASSPAAPPSLLPAAVTEALRMDDALDAQDAWEISLDGSSSLDDALPLALGDSTSVVDAETVVPESAAPPASILEALQ